MTNSSGDHRNTTFVAEGENKVTEVGEKVTERVVVCWGILGKMLGDESPRPGVHLATASGEEEASLTFTFTKQ